MNVLLFLLIGAAAGFIAEKVTGSPMGLLANLIVGVVGGFLFGLLGLAARGLVGSFVTATVGAVVLLFLVGLVQRKR
jgi:uncharacterized membrane protein YeaQ/YmgE (transglycosylase-associated protein family)